MATDKLFGGSFFFSNCPVCAALIIATMALSLIPAMFEVSSLLIYNPTLIVHDNQWWRLVTGLFCVTHPNVLMPIVFLYYISRCFEYERGSLEYANLLIVTVIFGSAPFAVLYFWKYYEDMYIVHYACTIAGAMGVAALHTNRLRWSGEVVKGLHITTNTATYVVLALLAINDFALEALLFTLWGAGIGILVVLRVPPFFFAGFCAKCRRPQTPSTVNDESETTSLLTNQQQANE